MKKYIKPVALNIFENKGLIPLVAGGASLAKAFAVGVSAGLMMGGRRDIYTPAIISINSKK